jgi:hypothetical protein
MEKQYIPQSKQEIEFDVPTLSERLRFGNQHQQINEVQHNRVGEEPNSVFFPTFLWIVVICGKLHKLIPTNRAANHPAISRLSFGN